ncbi:hypothetical protein FHN55_20975, partial [Streptomyces sp. NP160]|uniref:hypothetical protein n=1 Tax=Streptomyces sp. NP160 TaxID=2586637 RepID=UPI001167B8B6
MTPAQTPAPAARWRSLLPEVAWAVVVAAVCVASRWPQLPGADLGVAWPVLGLVVLWARRHRSWRQRGLVLAAAAAVVVVVGVVTGPDGPVAGLASGLASAAALAAGA